jgi:hypothetical protein
MAGKRFEAIRIYYPEAPDLPRVAGILHGKRNARWIPGQEKKAVDQGSS